MERTVAQMLFRNPNLKIVFAGSSVMRLKEENPELNGLCESYNLRGLSLREYVNLQSGSELKPYTLQEILHEHEDIVHEILQKANPQQYFNDYLHHGFYPLFLENNNYEENLLKSMNMTIEVDILLIKQIEQKYLSKIKKLFYLLATEHAQTLNISTLAKNIGTSRATVMNYIKYLADARLINIIYPQGESYPKKPTKVMLHNPNLVSVVGSGTDDIQHQMETFLVNSLWKDHDIHQASKGSCYQIDGTTKICVHNAQEKSQCHLRKDVWQANYNLEQGSKKTIPLWLFGFLY